MHSTDVTFRQIRVNLGPNPKNPDVLGIFEKMKCESPGVELEAIFPDEPSATTMLCRIFPRLSPTLLRARPSLPASSPFFSTTSDDPRDVWPALDSEVPIVLNDGDPTPTIQPYSEYPEWLLKLADTPETLAALSKEYEKHNVAKASETVDESVLMGYDRIMRLNKLENRQLIKGQNETANDL